MTCQVCQTEMANLPGYPNSYRCSKCGQGYITAPDPLTYKLDESGKMNRVNSPDRVNKYARVIKGVTVDFYDIARAFGVIDPAIQHALKKLLRYGCGEKPLAKDVDEAIYSLQRWQANEKLKASTEPGK